MPKYWGISLGEGGRYLGQARQGNFVAIGWGQLGDLSWLRQADEGKSKNRDKLTALMKTFQGGSGSPIKIGIDTGQLWNFVVQMAKGDIVLARDSAHRRVVIGNINGDYEYNPAWGDGCPYEHRRPVNWLKEVSRDDLSQKLKDSMGSLLTIFNASKHIVEIEALLAGDKVAQVGPAISNKTLAELLVQRLLDFSPQEFEEFITDLLSTLGFQTTVTEFVADKGVDIVGALNAEGVAEINLRVQVKRYGSGSVGISEVLKIRGTLAPDEHGALVTTARFTKSAREEAQAPSKKPIALVDKDGLVDLILKHFDELAPTFQQRLGLQRKKLPLEEQFVIANPVGL